MAILLLLSLSALTIPAQAQQPYTPRDLVLTVYADGVVQVEYSIEVDVSFARITVALFGTIFENLVVADQDGLPLDYFLVEGGITVDTLGASAAKITYFTADLTDKSGRMWILTADTPALTTIVLPPEATIISLNQLPTAIGSLGDKPLLTMPPGPQEIAYTLGIIGTREHALVLLNEAKNTVNKVKAQNILVTEAEVKLQEATEAFNRSSYAVVEQLAAEAQDLALQTLSLAEQASTKIGEAEASIEKSQLEGRITGLAEARQFLKQAKEAYVNGNYSQALEYAEEAEDEAVRATIPLPTPTPTPTPTPIPSPPPRSIPALWVIGGVAVAAVFLGLYFLLRKLKQPSSMVRERRVIDVDKILEQNPQLRHDDREVVQYVAECGGEALEAEIRERFKLPKTTVWRMMQRLRREGVADIFKIGGQNLIRIKPKYQKVERKTG